MIILLYCILGFLLGLLGITAYNAFTAPQLENVPQTQSRHSVSILIPARNEAAQIKSCLENVLAQENTPLEVLVLDDDSTDATAKLVSDVVKRDQRVKFIRGAPLPRGWIGKNWACHQLSEQATGEIFIFVDADIRCGVHAVAHTVAWMVGMQAGMLSAFPRQVTETLPEKMVVPVIYLFVYSFLPLWFAYRSRALLFAAANGQWIAFTRESYRRIGGHRAVRDQIVEDVELSRLAKRRGERILLVCGHHDLSCRMYDSWKSVWEGFSKNAFGLVGFRSGALIGLMAVCFMAFIFPYVAIFIDPLARLAVVAVLLNVVIRFILSVKYQQPIVGVFLHPLAVVFMMLIGLNSYRWFKSGKIRWKGRKLKTGDRI